MAKSAVLAPLLGQLDRGLLEIAGKLLQLAFETFKKGNRIGVEPAKPATTLSL